MNFEIIKADREYLSQIHELHNLANDIDKWDYSKFEQVFDCELPVLIIKTEGRIIGFIIYLVCLDEVRIINVSVHPEERKRGHAKRLLFSVFQEARDNNWRYVLLDVRVSNVAVKLYHDLGFRTLAIRKGFYDTQVEDAYFMQLELNEFEFEKHYLALINYPDNLSVG